MLEDFQTNVHIWLTCSTKITLHSVYNMLDDDDDDEHNTYLGK